MEAKYIHLEETQSTNSHLAGIASKAEHGTVVYADRQTAGRGQRGNTWESEPGKNITMSVLLKNGNVMPAKQFQLSEICALAVARTLAKYIGAVSIKWPNDIYYRDSKICGILIEHSLAGGKIDHTIMGIGLNVNQTEFHSDAPNPISIAMIKGEEVDVEEIIHEIAERILELCDQLPAKASEIHRAFLNVLYRRSLMCDYHSVKDSVSDNGLEKIAAGDKFTATICDVEPDGMLLLRTDRGGIHRFAFKEVEFVIPRHRVSLN